VKKPPGSGASKREGREPDTRLDAVLLRALELEDAERSRYLEDIAADEPALADAARQRLAGWEDVGSTFLGQPAAARLEGDEETIIASRSGAETDDSAALPAADRYRLGRLLGQGGMGRVVEAQDRLLGRRVAIKFFTHPDPSVRHLFLAEGRAQARIRHDHVLEIYDGGELGGQPFLAMRCVEGGTLEEMAPSLPLEQRVRLLAQAAEGLHAAHRQGLLHRDVKPSNILVEKGSDGELTAYVSDFGIAAELGDAALPVGEAVAGSPHYIAPEVLAGNRRVDRRADIYSLGMTLHRVLTGTLPFSGPLTADILRQTLEGEIPPPRNRNPDLPAEIEAIILRCLARDPSDRYASARAVAEDLQRYLDGEVVEAYAAGIAYRLTRFALRHRAWVTVGVVVAALLVVAAVAVAVFAVRADAARQRAELRQGQAEELIRFMVVDLQEELEPGSRLAVLEDIAGAALDYFAAVPEEELSEEELLRRSRTLYQLGQLRIRQGNLRGAADPMGQSLALTRRLAALDPSDSERLFELGQSWFWVGFVAWEQGDLAATRGPWQEYLEISRRVVERDPANLDWQLELSYAHSNLGSLAEAEGQLETALEQFGSALAINRGLVDADPTNRSWRLELAACHNTLAVTLEALGALAEAREHFLAELGLLTALAADDPTDLRVRDRLATSHSYAGKLLSLLGRLPAAEEHLLSAHGILIELVEHDEAQAQWRYKLALSHLDLGRLGLAKADPTAAEHQWRQAETLVDQLIAADPSTDDWRRTRGVILFHRALLETPRARDQALATVREAVELLVALTEEHPDEHRWRRWLGWARLLLGNLEVSPEARHSAFAAAIAGLEPFARESRDGRLLAPWAEALRCVGRRQEAQAVDDTLREMGYSEAIFYPSCPAHEQSTSSRKDLVQWAPSPSTSPTTDPVSSSP
jgi:tetratricopeptide (TPR) repeat protein